MIWTAIDINEPPGKALKHFKPRRITLTYINPKEDTEVRPEYGTAAKRRQQIPRISQEAKDQQALLTQEDLAEILGSDVRTIHRDIHELNRQQICVPTRGQQKDIGSGVIHRVKAVLQFLQDKEPLEIARSIRYSLTAAERYIDTFCRVVYCQRKFRNTLKTAMVVGVSMATVNTYLDLHGNACEEAAYRERISEIEQRGRIYYKALDFKKSLGGSKGGRNEVKKSAKQSQFGPLQKKTFASALDRFFEEQCPQLGGLLTRQVNVNHVQRLVEEFYPPHSHLRMGQVMWPAVDENETAAYGKSIEKTKLKPVFVDMITPEDIEAMLKGEKAKRIRQRVAVRLFEEAKEQQAVFTGVDVATMMRLSPATISNYVRDWEKQHQTSVPHRGTIHDMGRSVTTNLSRSPALF